MRDAHRKEIGRLYGVGIGPGDPKLLTLKAKEVLEKADIIFAPKANSDTGSCARFIIEAVISRKKKITQLAFPMTKDKAVLRKYWGKAASQIAKAVKRNKCVVFVTIGDPFIYSTFIYLLETLRKDFPEIKTEIIPGVSAFNAASARLEAPLVKGNEKLAVLPVSGNLKEIEDVFLKFDTVVLMKIGSRLNQVVSLLRKKKLINRSLLISRIGCANEKIVRDISSLKDESIGYLSIIIVRCNTNTGVWVKR